MRLPIILLTLSYLVFGQSSKVDYKIGKKIHGNFLGNGKKVTATAIKTKEANGNPVEDGTPAEFEIRFSDSQLKPIKVGCCETILINEGDLNNDGTDEISTYQAPMNGCTYTMTTYSFIKENWIKIVQPFLIPTGCENLTEKDLQNRVFKENKNVYFLANDMSNEKGKLIRRKAVYR
ncbi:hypothetical protein [Epilithonimonas arachidiradicis]|uniref:Uncharacterized protein n=1 Tax=Epilithonimonas arachidiradicis TaxID=1617282 RepID=A0A420CLD5_9FLAO|nr:hypothetical protein [Epilithonimonas arachidiradicis]RKE79152.1 hypothetical protein BXY58_3419 [Epilithonimonas arachidiradicis]GGG60609.1 hypothetical protein GCM10007332_22920 [Epilithonimonas arachidiradicis]